MANLSRATLEFLHALLVSQAIPVNDPDFRSHSLEVASAKEELEAALEAALEADR